MCRFQMGGWQAVLYACTPDMEEAVREFSLSTLFVPDDREAQTPSRVVLVAGPSIVDDRTFMDSLDSRDRKEWGTFLAKLEQAYRRYRTARSLDDRPGKQPSELFPFIWPSQEKAGHRQFIAMIFDHPETVRHTRIWGYCFFRAACWHLEHGGLQIHSAAVARGEDGFLFLGESEAGKSTVVQMSASIGLTPLGDDLNFILKEPAGGYRLSAIPGAVHSPVGYSMKRPYLRGIFLLVKDERDFMVPLTPMRLTRTLFDGFNFQAPYVHQLPDELVKRGFHSVGEMARTIPGYELHFRKSPDFWQLIHEHFPG